MAGAPTSAGREKRCGVCGHESRQPGFRPPVPEQAPDLDLRPGEPVRSTMARWLEACPHCDYAAPNIAEAHPAGAQAVAAAPYRALIADTAHPVLARRFLAWAHVLEETGALHAAAEATLHAAWVADDLNRDDLARQWRREAVALWRSGPALDAEQSVRVIDALRRAGDFAEAEGAAEALAALNPPEAVAQVTALEARLIAAEDTGRHSMASALAPPARRPHVTHQKSPGVKKRPPEGGGLKSWLRRIFKG
jgi:hypothetical protein